MSLLYYLIIVITVALTGMSFLYRRSIQKNRTVFLEQRETIAKLKMENIRVRMSPHFIFNTLSALSGIPDSPPALSQKIKTLLILLRNGVDNIEKTAIPLQEELTLVKGYLELQQLRVPKPFNVTYESDSGVDMMQSVPAMILQIPVENAIKHGLMPLEGEKSLRIKLNNYQKGLELTVEDNGIGYRKSVNRSMGSGTGIKTLFQTIELINQQNGEKIEFLIQDKEANNPSEGGTIITIKIPKQYSYPF